MRKLRYHLVDVFTDRVFGGNPLAVFTNGRGIQPELMQSIAKELNLSETTFVLPPEDPENDYRVRIFTPGAELPMAGHPTVGTSFILAREHMIEPGAEESNIKLEEIVGTIPVNINFKDGAPDLIWMQQPLPHFGPRFEDAGVIAEMLSIAPEAIETNLPLEVVSCGVPFLFVPLKDLESSRAIRFRLDVWERTLRGFGVSGVFVFTKETEMAGSSVHSRMFAPGLGIMEDPATGGASGPLGCYLVHHGVFPSTRKAEFTSEQGIEMGRPSFIKIIIEQEAGEITSVRVGGQCRFMGEGYLEVG
ncbi:MAG: trans-2,3-dihydro-3-hydroxyanthranilate isomerase [Acidobacteriota bacterium]|jgi:trans-2,3-dihydro-3-hydroxyanthranilate isomerase|nr:trans-2,3-dihydro-3-hydroxyanthranilate isomerase [Acidobacteriota bacterium]